MKRISIYIFLLHVITNTFAQNVTITDVNFLNALKALGVDANNDNAIQVSEATSITKLIIYNKSITNLTGIEAFTSLTYLACDTNQLTNLNLSANTLLDTLLCNNNQITNLDLSSNTALKKLNVAINSLTSINVSTNTSLVWFDCGGNNITSLDLTQNVNLEYLDIVLVKLTTVDLSNNPDLTTLLCSGIPFGFPNKLTSLDVRNNILLTTLMAAYNPDLNQICVTEDQKNNKVSSWTKDAGCSWNSDPNCPQVITTDVNELIHSATNPKVIHIFDILGNELEFSEYYNGIIIYLYEDGTTKKVLNIY